jgi:hypothetical protein
MCIFSFFCKQILEMCLACCFLHSCLFADFIKTMFVGPLAISTWRVLLLQIATVAVIMWNKQSHATNSGWLTAGLGTRQYPGFRKYYTLTA